MTNRTMTPGQKAVEDRFEQLKNIPVDPEKTAAAQFGEMESWMFSLGEYRLFLNPMTKRWYFFDRAHNYWKDLNAPAGTVIFSLRGTDLEMAAGGSGTAAAGQAAPAGAQERRFCPQCGSPLKPGLKFCSSCGAKIS